MALSMPINFGEANSVGEKISSMKLKACVIFSDLKNIHAKTVRLKVKIIEIPSLKLGKKLIVGVIRFVDFFLPRKDGKK